MNYIQSSADALAAEVRAFVADPDLDRIGEDNPSSALYLSWDPDDPTVPVLRLRVSCNDQVVAVAAANLADLPDVPGVVIVDTRPSQVVVVEGPDRQPTGEEYGASPGTWFSVALHGPAYAGLLAEDALRGAARWREAALFVGQVAELLETYVDRGGDVTDSRYLDLLSYVEANR